MKNMMAELKDKKTDMLEKRDTLKSEYKKIPENLAGERNRMMSKI